MRLHLPAEAPLLLAFAELPDPRKSRNQIYPLSDILAVAILGVICGGNSWASIARWGNAHLDWFQSVNLCLIGMPSHDTLSRFFRMLDPKAFETRFIQWTQMIADRVQGVVALDGKTICNSDDMTAGTKALHLVSAFAAENELILGQVATDSKSNEITAIPELLNMLNIKDTVITIDAMGCQKEIARIIREKKGDYVLALKGNQGHLYDEVLNFFEQAMRVTPEEADCDRWIAVGKEHGRVEEREIWVSSEIDWLESKEEWMGLQSVVCVKSRRTRHGKTTEEARYYISSLASHAARHGEVIRQHWAVENKLHWHLDVTFNEDKCKIRAKNGPENFSLLKRIALNVIKADKTEQGGVEAKRLMAGWKPDYRLRLLGVK